MIVKGECNTKNKLVSFFIADPHPILSFPTQSVSYVVTYRFKPISQTKPFRNILIHPSHNHNHLFMNFLYTIQIPTNGFIMKHPVSECTERIQRS